MGIKPLAANCYLPASFALVAQPTFATAAAKVEQILQELAFELVGLLSGISKIPL